MDTQYNLNNTLDIAPKTNVIISDEDLSCLLWIKNQPLTLIHNDALRLLITEHEGEYAMVPLPSYFDLTNINPVLIFEMRPSFFTKNNIDAMLLEQLRKRDLFFKESIALKDLLEAIKQEQHLRQKATAYQFLTVLIDTQINITMKGKSKKHTDVQIIQLVEAILREQVYGHELPTINGIAAKMGISGSKLKLMYQVHFNEGMYQHYLNLKFNASKELLHTHSVGKTADLVGFKVVSKFIVGFKKRFKITPYKYKQSQLY